MYGMWACHCAQGGWVTGRHFGAEHDALSRAGSQLPALNYRTYRPNRPNRPLADFYAAVLPSRLPSAPRAAVQSVLYQLTTGGVAPPAWPPGRPAAYLPLAPPAVALSRHDAAARQRCSSTCRRAPLRGSRTTSTSRRATPCSTTSTSPSGTVSGGRSRPGASASLHVAVIPGVYDAHATRRLRAAAADVAGAKPGHAERPLLPDYRLHRQRFLPPGLHRRAARPARAAPPHAGPAPPCLRGGVLPQGARELPPA
jgi:hypothetical protein